jgi:hypothetical protein
VSTSLREDTRPLTDRERQLLTRLLSDPTVYPFALKDWLVGYLETSDIDLPMTSVHGLLEALRTASVATVRRLPSGTVLLYDGPAAPEGSEEHPDAAVQAAAPPGLMFIRVL